MTTKERIKKARDLQATYEHHLSLAYLQIVKDCLKKNSTLKYYCDVMGSQHFVDNNNESVGLTTFHHTKNGDYVGDLTKPSFAALFDFLEEFPNACLPCDTVYRE